MKLYIYFKPAIFVYPTTEIAIRYTLVNPFIENKGYILLQGLNIPNSKKGIVNKLLDESFIREENGLFIHKADFLFHFEGGEEKRLYSKVSIGSIFKNPTII